jgi:hypothetical protein
VERWTNKHKQETEQTNWQTTNKQKISSSGTIEFQSEFEFWCYSPSMESWYWYLSRSSVVVSLGDWAVFFFFFLLSFRGSCLVSSSLSEVWQFKFAFCPQVQEISSVAYRLSCFGVGFSLCWFTGGLFLCLTPFSGASSVICQLARCCQRVVMVCWLFFNFVELFDFGCCSLAL